MKKNRRILLILLVAVLMLTMMPTNVSADNYKLLNDWESPILIAPGHTDTLGIPYVQGATLDHDVFYVYKFSVDVPSIVTFNISTTPKREGDVATNSLSLTLYTSKTSGKGIHLFSKDNNNQSVTVHGELSSPSIDAATKLLPGVYYAVAFWDSTHYSSAYGTFKFKSMIPVANDQEPNDTWDQAVSVTMGSDRGGNLGYFGKVKSDETLGIDLYDYFKFTVPRDNTKIRVSGTSTVDPNSLNPSTFQPQVGLLNSSGVPHSAMVTKLSQEGDTIGYNIAKAGTYILRVEAYDWLGNNRIYNYGVEYTFHIDELDADGLVIPTTNQLNYTILNKVYNGKAQGINVTPKAGVGTITVKYNGSTAVPVKAGTYNVTADIAKGTVYGAVTGLSLGTYTISKIDMSQVKSITISDMIWTGKQLKPTKFKIDGVEFSVKSNDVKATYGKNKNVGKGTVVLKGGGTDFIGTKSVSFNILPKKSKAAKITAGKKQFKVTWKKVSSKQKISKYEVRYRIKGTSKWKTKSYSASKSSAIIKGLKKGKKYEVQVRSYKKVSGKKYFSPWSKTKTSGKIK